MKILTIVIPVYNTNGKYFEKCLKSLECKQKELIEVIVVDDGSEEKNKTEIKRIMDRSLLNYFFYEKTNGGQNSARQYGLKLAIGNYILFLDSDDYVNTDALDNIICMLVKNKPKILAYNYDVVTADGTVLEEHMRWDGRYENMDIIKGLKYCDSLCLSIYHRETLLKSKVKLVQGVRIGEDFATATAILSSIDCANTTDEILYHYMKHPGSALSSPPAGSELDILKAFDLMMNQVSETKLIKYYAEFEWLAILHVLYYGQERILRYYKGNKLYLLEIWNWINKKFPNWKNNSYLHSEEITMELPFKFIIHKQANLLRILRSFKRHFN